MYLLNSKKKCVKPKISPIENIESVHLDIVEPLLSVYNDSDPYLAAINNICLTH